jgi:glycosyltransferase involved in cell wall biosynthesis
MNLGPSAFTASRPSLAGRTILQILPRLDAGGAERTTLDVAAAVVQAGGRALVACAGGRMVSELQALGGVWAPFPADVKNPFRMALNVRKLARLIVDERADLGHARSRAPAWVALGAARMVERPLVTTYHGAYGGGSALKLRYNSVMARGDVVIANSRYTAESILRLYPFARDRLRVIPRGADLQQFSPGAVDPARVTALRQAWEVAPDERIVLLAARLTGWKGQKLLIEAAAKLRRDGVRFILAGDPQGRDGYVREIDRAIDAAGLKGVVKRVGHCRDMPAALLAASALVAPSIEPEAFGRSAVEAQAMGTPVVVSDLGAAPETVLAPPEVSPDMRTGWRVPSGDAEALAEALSQALALGAAARDAMARRARAHVEQNFSLERMTRETLDAYATVLGL